MAIIESATTRYRFSTRIGMFCIERGRTGCWSIALGRKRFGAFRTADLALADLLDAPRDWPAGARNSSLGLPTDLAGWAPSQTSQKKT